MLATMTLNQVATAIHGSRAIGDCQFDRVSIDTRSIQPDDLFVALKGERFDAHDFLDQAVAAKAAGLVVEKHVKTVSVPQLIVDDSTKALGKIANLNRQQFAGPVIGITGSGGKTTVKNLVRNILQHCGETFATQGNLNNHIGVPLTLFELSPQHRFAVIEMGASGPGEIAYLAEIAEPSVGVVTNALRAHVAGFGSVEGVAKAKGEMFLALKDSGIAIVNIDDPSADIWLEQIGFRQHYTFSLINNNADFNASDITDLPAGGTQFTLIGPSFKTSVRLLLLGRQNVANALAAAACAYAAGADVNAIKLGLEETSAYTGRMQHRQGINKSRVIDDSYNANPDAVKAAIDYLAKQPGNSILVLGDMGELGESEVDYHRELGQYAAAAGISQLISKGQLAKESGRAFGSNTKHFDDFDELNNYLKSIITADSVVLVKGSRIAQMENVVSAIASDGAN